MGPFGCLTELCSKRAELVQKFVPRSRVGSFRYERTRSTPMDPKLTFCCVLYYLGPFGCLTELGAKRAELVQTFVPRSRVGIFCNECTRSTALDPKLTFWCISFYLVALGTIWLPYETRCKTGGTSAKVRATKSHQNFSQGMHPIHPVGPKLMFGCILDCFVTARSSIQNELVQLMQKFVPTNSHRNFSQRTHPIHPIGP